MITFGTGASGWLVATRAALTPARAPWAVGGALVAFAAAGSVAVVGDALGALTVVGVAFFGAACAAVFVNRGPYRQRAALLAGQAFGACAGIGIGTACTTDLSRLVAAIVVAAVAGLVGTAGGAATAGSVMAVIGLAFGAFGRVDLSAPGQIGAYLLGTAAVGVAALGAWPWRRDRPERDAVAAVCLGSARLLEAAGGPQSERLRSELAVASSLARTAVYGRLPRRVLDRRGQLRGALAVAEELALLAAAAHADGRADPVRAAEARAQADRLRTRPLPIPSALPAPPDPPAVRFATRTGIATAARLAWCIGIATAVTEALHDESHSYWIPLTVAVLIRPEYASVFVRSVNRLAGTLAGALVAAAVLTVADRGLPVAAAAAVAIAGAVFAAPRLYAFAVVGVTCGALLSASIPAADPVAPLLRVADTALGALISIVFGYLLWPGRGLPEPQMGVARAVAAAAAYLDAVETGSSDRRVARDRDIRVARDRDIRVARDRAYAAAHRARAVAESALADPPPVAALAARELQRALDIERLVDAITAYEREASPSTEQLAELRRRLGATRSLGAARLR